MTIVGILAAVLFIGAFVAAVQFGYRLCVTYELGAEELGVRLCGLRMLRVRYDQIDDVRVVAFKETWITRTAEMFNAIRAGNRLFFREAVVVRRTSGIRRAVIITPDRPVVFAQDLKVKAAQAKHMSPTPR